MLHQNNFKEKSSDFAVYSPCPLHKGSDQEEHRVNLCFPFRGGQRSTLTLPPTTAAAAVTTAGWLMLPWADLVFRAFTNKCRCPHILPCRPPRMLLVFLSCWRHLTPIWLDRLGPICILRPQWGSEETVFLISRLIGKFQKLGSLLEISRL